MRSGHYGPINLLGDARWKPPENPLAFIADALACAQGIQLGLDLGVTILEIEGNALSIIKKSIADG